MTLTRQLGLFLALLLCLLFGASLLVKLVDARDYVRAQLKSHAQDTATSLGLSIATADADNIALVDSMIDAIFDRGHYQEISFTDMDGEMLVMSRQPMQLEGVPNWFVRIVSFHVPSATTEVSNGWEPTGILKVISHPGYAYQSLWRETKESVVLFGVALLISMVVLVGLLRLVLRPLDRVEKQADAICQRRFEVQPVLPRTRELRRVVEAMNRMAGKLQHLFNEKVTLTERLRDQSRTDELTGMLNRRAFDDQVAALMESDRGDAGGSLTLIHMNGLQQVNLQQGRAKGDDILLSISERINQISSSFPESIVARHSGSEFTLFMPGSDQEQARALSLKLYKTIITLPWFDTKNEIGKLELATVICTSKTGLRVLMSEADQVLRGLQTQGRSGWQVKPLQQTEVHHFSSWPADEWRTSLRDVMERQDVELYAQPVFDREGKILHREILSRMMLRGELASAAAFLPMVERFDFSSQFDQIVIEKVLQWIEAHPDDDSKFCVNLSTRSIQKEIFRHWLTGRLKKTPELASRLIVEVPEYTLHLVAEELMPLVEELEPLGCSLSLDHFGTGTRALSYLKQLNIDYLKIDNTFVRQLDSHEGNQFFIHSLSLIAHNRDIILLGQGVESEETWQQLLKLGVDGGQGFHLGRPEAL
ncbi:EAL domain-containing protein [Spongorhabdus nitratireducens]